MDLDIRKDFTPYVKFVDFTKNDGSLENQQYGPALMQKKQESKQVDESS